MADWSSALEFGSQPVVEYYNMGYTVRLMVMVRIMIRFGVRVSQLALMDRGRYGSGSGRVAIRV